MSKTQNRGLAARPACAKALDWNDPVTEVLTLLYLRSARLAPSRAPARVSDGVVRDV